MRSLVVFRLAAGLFAGGVAVASPCKPISVTTTSEDVSIVSVSSETTSVTLAISSTTDVSATSVTSESFAETSTFSSLETVSLTSIETSAISTFAAESTTAEPTTTAATTTAATTTAAIPTFTLSATGESVVEGDSLYSYNSQNSVVVFDPNPAFGSASVQPYTIDSQGRLVNDQGYFLCGYYLATNNALDAPASVSTCVSERPKAPFLHCELSSGLELQCRIPARSCAFNPNGEPLCEETGGIWSTWSAGVVFVGHGLMIGPVDTPDTYERIGLHASIV